MTQFQESLRPYGVLFSYVTRDAPPPTIPATYDGGLETYVGAPDWPIAYEALEPVAANLPDPWRPFIASAYKLKTRRLKQYSFNRYVVRFDGDQQSGLLALLLGMGNLENVGALIRRSDPDGPGDDLRPDTSGAAKLGWSSAILTLFDLREEATSDVEASFRAVLGQDGERSLLRPSRFQDLLFTKGPTVGTLLDSAAVLRLSPPPTRSAICVPQVVIDWMNVADQTYIVRDLGARLGTQPLLAGAPEEYLPDFAAADIPALYEQFAVRRASALNASLEGREIVNELASSLQGNPFVRGAGEASEEDDEDEVFSFRRRVASGHASEIIAFEANERRLAKREEEISSFLRDAASWHASRAQGELARTNNRLIASIADLNRASISISETISTATESTDRLTARVVRLTKWLIALTIATLVVTLVGAVGAWLTDRMKEGMLSPAAEARLDTASRSPSSTDQRHSQGNHHGR